MRDLQRQHFICLDTQRLFDLKDQALFSNHVVFSKPKEVCGKLKKYPNQFL